MNQHVANVLIAEDSPTQAAQFIQFLKELGYSVSAARSGVEAYQLAVADPPDILISDIVMPGMDGYELCRRLKETPGLEETPVILVTSLSQPQDVLAGLEAGADNFIIKPYDESILGARINYLLQNKSLRRTEQNTDTLEIEVSGERHSITARKQQILDLLISTYAQAVHLFSALDQGRQELSQSYELLQALYEMTEGLNRCRTPADVALTAVSRSLGLPGVRDAWIYQRDEDGLRLTAERHVGRGTRPDPLPPTVTDLETADDSTPQGPVVRPIERFPGAGTSGCHVSLRLMAGSRVNGYLHLIGSDSTASDEMEIRTLAGIGNQISTTLDRALLHISLENEVRKRTQRLVQESEERRKAMETITAILNASPVGIVALDAALDLSTWNAAAREIFGYADDAGILGMPWRTLFGEVPSALRDGIAQIRSGRELKPVEVDVTSADGQRLSLHVAGEALIDADGLFRGAVLTIDNITERKQVREQLHQAQKMEAVGNLTGGIAHDFNNLLTTIIGNLDIAVFKSGDSDLRPLLDAALRAALRGAELTRKLLAFARKQPLESRVVGVRSTLDELRVLLEGTLGTGVTLALEVADDTPDIFVDPVGLESAIMNLAINARDAMPEGGRLTIRVARAPVEGEARLGRAGVVFSVSDTGTGIPPELRERIFEPFFTTKASGKGTGLGLAMVYGFARQSGGSLSLESVMGVGTTFHLVVPAHDGEPAGDAPPDAAARAFAPKSILLVEGSPEVLRTVQSILTNAGHRVHAVASAEEALADVRAGRRYDVLLSDVGLTNGMDGWTLADAYRALAPESRVLLMSGLADPRREGPPGSVYSILPKPFGADMLGQAILSLFEPPARGDVDEDEQD